MMNNVIISSTQNIDNEENNLKDSLETDDIKKLENKFDTNENKRQISYHTSIK